MDATSAATSSSPSPSDWIAAVKRPMTARGVIFLNLEDETGLLNVIVLPGVWQANREVARKSIGVVLDGVLEHRDGVTNLVARRFTAWSEEIDGLHSRDWARGGR